MKKEYLMDYFDREVERYNLFLRQRSLRVDELNKTDHIWLGEYSDTLPRPITIADPDTYHLDKQKIWSQIPFAPTLVVPLINVNKEKMLESNGFALEDIPNLMQMSKEGKIVFALVEAPPFYEGLDHLEPIFQELKPPILRRFDHSDFMEQSAVDALFNEFDTVSKISHHPWLVKRSHQKGESEWHFVYQYLGRFNAYAHMKILGLTELSELILNMLVDNPILADALLLFYGNAISPLFRSFRANENVSLKKYKWGFGAKVNQDKIPSPLTNGRQGAQFPIDIGQFLIRKQGLNPTDYNGCRLVMDTYKDNALYKVLESIDKGVRERSKHGVLSSTEELGIIMDNIWNDAKRITSSSRVIKGGFEIALGIVAFGLTSGVLGPAAAGLLSTLGIPVATKLMKAKDVGEIVAKKINKDYVVNIHNFTKAYPKDSQRAS